MVGLCFEFFLCGHSQEYGQFSHYSDGTGRRIEMRKHERSKNKIKLLGMYLKET